MTDKKKIIKVREIACDIREDGKYYASTSLTGISNGINVFIAKYIVECERLYVSNAFKKITIRFNNFDNDIEQLIKLRLGK